MGDRHPLEKRSREEEHRREKEQQKRDAGRDPGLPARADKKTAVPPPIKGPSPEEGGLRDRLREGVGTERPGSTNTLGATCTYLAKTLAKRKA